MTPQEELKALADARKILVRGMYETCSEIDTILSHAREHLNKQACEIAKCLLAPEPQEEAAQ